MDFNEPETPLTMADVNRALTTLFTAMGPGATRKHIADALVGIAGVAQPRDVPEEGYAKVIEGIEALAATYTSGKRKLA